MLSNSVIAVMSQDGDANILFNTATGSSIKYLLQDFPNLSDFVTNSEITSFLREEGFLGKVDSEKIIADYGLYQEEQLHLLPLVHENCNFRCTYCYEKFEKSNMNDEVVQGIIRYVKNRLSEENSKIKKVQISWFGGEPLLNVKAIRTIGKELIKICKFYGVEYVSSITTNGYTLTKKLYLELSSLGVGLYQITLDGPEEIHDSQRKLLNGNGTYARIMFNLLDIIKEGNDDDIFLIRTNVGPNNIQYMDRHIENLTNKFRDDKRFHFSFHNVGNWGDNDIKILSEDVVAPLLEKVIKSGGQTTPISWMLSPYRTCYAGLRNTFVIGSDGMIYKCTVALYDSVNQIGYLTPAGEMNLDSEKHEKWCSPRITPECKCCSVLSFCFNNYCPLKKINSEDDEVCLFDNKDYLKLIQLLDQQNLIDYDVQVTG